MDSSSMAVNDSVFYVYEHWRPDTDECFYVGKGHGDRSAVFPRNRLHENILNKLVRLGLEAEVRIVKSGLSEVDAFALEIELIARHGRKNIGTGSLANLTDGGEGSTGWVCSEESRTRLSAAQTALWKIPAHRAKQSAARKGNHNAFGYAHSAATKAKVSAANKGRIPSAETRAKISAAKVGNQNSLGNVHSAATKAAMSAARKAWWAKVTPEQRSLSPEHIAKISAAKKGKKFSPEHCAKIGAANKARIWTKASRAKLSVSLTGKTLSPEHRAKVRSSQKGRTRSPEVRAKISAGMKAHRTRERQVKCCV